MSNKMAEFPGKLAIFWQKRPSLREAARGDLLKISKLRGGGILEIFDLRGGILAIPPPLVDPWLKSELFTTLLTICIVN